MTPSVPRGKSWEPFAYTFLAAGLQALGPEARHDSRVHVSGGEDIYVVEGPVIPTSSSRPGLLHPHSYTSAPSHSFNAMGT